MYIHVECRPNLLTLDRPRPVVLTLDLALFWRILILHVYSLQLGQHWTYSLQASLNQI